MTATQDATTQKFAVELRKIDDIRPYERNPRLNDQAVDAVAASLAEFGFRQPIVVDEDGVAVWGYSRRKAAHKLGPVEWSLDRLLLELRERFTGRKAERSRAEEEAPGVAEASGEGL